MLIAGHGTAGGSISIHGHIAATANRPRQEQLVLATGEGSGPVMVLSVVSSIVAGVEARSSAHTGCTCGLMSAVLILLLASYSILHRRDRAIAALVVAAKGHGEHKPSRGTDSRRCCRWGKRMPSMLGMVEFVAHMHGHPKRRRGGGGGGVQVVVSWCRETAEPRGSMLSRRAAESEETREVGAWIGCRRAAAGLVVLAAKSRIGFGFDSAETHGSIA